MTDGRALGGQASEVAPRQDAAGRIVRELEATQFAELSVGLLAQGASLRFRADGGSMAPFIRDGEVLTVVPLAGRSIRLGDVALYRTAAGGLFAHRVLGRRRRGGRLVLEIRGDASRGSYEEVVATDLLGRVIGGERFGKYRRLDAPVRRWAALVWIRLTPLWLLRLRRRPH